ncbi:MAG: hypothetical protein LBQ58_05725 [Synergistaceae bacterium]|nr:hypothetical protein [Synergistaceae bacterium]
MEEHIPKIPLRALILLLVLGLIIGLFVAAASSPPEVAPKIFTVQSFDPQGEISAPVVIKIVFSSEVARSEDLVEFLASEDMPFSISPALSGYGKWADALTFFYQPTNGIIADATKYEFTIREDLKDLNGTPITGPTVFSFSSPPLTFKNVAQTGFSVNENYVDYEISFNYPVNPTKLKEFMSVKDGSDRGISYSFNGAEPQTGALIRGDNPESSSLRNIETSSTVGIRVPADDASPISLHIKEGLTSERGPLGLTKPVSRNIKRDMKVLVRESYAFYEGSSNGRIYIETSTPIDIERAHSFIEISPERAFSIEQRWGSSFMIVADFKPRELITVKIHKGLPSHDGPTSLEEWEKVFIMPEIEPNIFFTTQGQFISPANDELLIPVSTVNMYEIQVSVMRVYDNNVPFAARHGWPYSIYDLAENIFSKKYDTRAKPNERKEFSIDLKKILNGRLGLFDVRVSEEKSWNSISRIVNVTDIAGSAKISDKGALIWANSILSGKHLSGVKVSIYSSSNQLLASGVTDYNGVCWIKRDSRWDENLWPRMAILERAGDVSVLHFNDNIWQIGDGSYSGIPYPTEGYQGICFTPRGVFRPGETVPVEMIIRKPDLSPEKPFPVLVRTRTSTGREWSKSTVTLSELGMASTEIQLSDASPTGSWSIDILIPGDDAPIAECEFLVEDFAPPKILVEVNADREIILGGESTALDIFAEYLFGAPADGLHYEVTSTFIPREYSHPNWSGYGFFDNRISFTKRSNTDAVGNLSESGNARVELPAVEDVPTSMLDVTYNVGVMEDSGRWVYKNVTLPYYPRKTLLGIKMPYDDLVTNKDIPFSIAAIEHSGIASDLKNAHITINRVKSRTIVTTTDGEQRSEIHYEYTPLEGYESLPISFENGVYTSEMKIALSGRYQIIVEDTDTGASAAQNFFVYSPGWWNYSEEEEATLSESLNITLDKEIYSIGDIGVAHVSGSFEGSMLMTVETSEVLQHYVKENNSKENEFRFKVTPEMAPNAWVTAHLIKPAVSEDVWSSHRAFGAVPIKIDTSDRVLSIEISSPEKIVPAARNDFSLQLRDKYGRPLRGEASVILVDDAVLSLTSYRTPNFMESYTRRRRLTVGAYDIYEALMPIYLKTPEALAPGGGDDAMQATLTASLSPVKANRFKVLTEVKRIITDNTGRADFSLDVPEFAGRARLMVIAASERAFGSFEQLSTITRDLVSDITLPRVLAPGDEFDSQIQLFNRSGTSIDITAELEIAGPISILQTEDVSNRTDSPKRLFIELEIPPTDELFAIPLKLKADASSGVAVVTLRATYADNTQEQVIELAVRPPYPRVTKSGAVRIAPGETAQLELPANWFPGTRRAAVAMSGMPDIGLANAARFLLNYPYYCLEQTVSSGWMLLSLPDLVGKIDAKLVSKGELRYQISRRLMRIQSMQSYDGGFTSWYRSAPNYWGSVYATHFMIASNKSGYEAPSEALRASLEYIRRVIASTPDITSYHSFANGLSLRAYIAYVLACNGETPLGWMSYLRDNLTSMQPYGRLLLAAAYAKLGEKGVARELIGEYAPPIVKSQNDQELPNYDSPLRTKAIQLLAWNALDPSSAGAVNAASDLLRALHDTPLYTTQEVGFAMLSLSEFYSYNSSDGKALLELTGPDSSLLASSSGDESVNKQIDDGVTQLLVKNTGDGVGFASWTTDGVPVEKPESESIGIEASVEYVEYANSTETILPANIQVKRGDKLIGTIKLKALGGTLQNIVVSLPLAGGLEIENPRFADPNQGDASGGYGDYYTYITSRAELRDDRLILFVDEFQKEFTWKFALRAVTSGTFTLPPIAAEGMYSPGIRCIGETSQITIK